MIRRIRRFMALPSAEKRLFAEAYGTLGMMRVAILTISFKKLTKGLNHTSSAPVLEPLNDEESEMVRKIAKAINQAAVHTPWESACLAQSLTAQKMLKRRGIHGMFYLGVNKEGEDMKAHAWTQCGDTIVTGKAGHEAFTVLSVLSWGRE